MCFVRFLEKKTGKSGKTSFETGAGTLARQGDGLRPLRCSPLKY
jgi:hypothetical protein